MRHHKLPEGSLFLRIFLSRNVMSCVETSLTSQKNPMHFAPAVSDFPCHDLENSVLPTTGSINLLGKIPGFQKKM